LSITHYLLPIPKVIINITPMLRGELVGSSALCKKKKIKV
jgi:hypothetical protein